jgi:hypothetical protein
LAVSNIWKTGKKDNFFGIAPSEKAWHLSICE